MNKIDIIIFERLYERPCWAKTFYRMKAYLTALVAAGYVERIAPPSSINTAKNMVALTPKGIDRIERHWKAQRFQRDIVDLAERLADNDEAPETAGKALGMSKAQSQAAFEAIVLDLGRQAA